MIEISRFGSDPLPNLLPSAVEVWSVRDFEVTPSVLDAEERRRAAAFRRAQDRAIYEAAHSALRILTGAYLSQDPAAVRFRREECPGCGGPHGRPALPGHPLHFSVSHTEGLALLAFASAPVGIDVEVFPAEDLIADVATTLHPSEQKELGMLHASERPLAFARCWTRKEAYLKGTGEGLASDGLAGTAVGAGPCPLPVEGWTIVDLPVPVGYAAALAVAEGARARNSNGLFPGPVPSV